jgi:hypothetical protein
MSMTELQEGLNLTSAEVSRIYTLAGIGTVRKFFADLGFAPLNRAEASLLRLATAYIMHCRGVSQLRD